MHIYYIQYCIFKYPYENYAIIQAERKSGKTNNELQNKFLKNTNKELSFVRFVSTL